VRQQPPPELAQHRAIEPVVAEFQAQRVLPVDPAAHRLGRLAIRQPFAELQEGRQGQAPRCQGGPPVDGEQIRERHVGEHLTQRIGQPEVRMAWRERRAGDARGLLGHRRQRLRAQQLLPPSSHHESYPYQFSLPTLAPTSPSVSNLPMNQFPRCCW